MTLTIQAGRYYWRRDGEREGPMARSSLVVFGWKTPAGRHWYSGGRFLNSQEHPLDLIAEAPAGDGWVFWRGGKCPVGADTLVDYQVRGGQQARIAVAARQIRWDHCGCDGDIIAYRVLKPAPAEPPCDGKQQRTLEAAEAEASSLKIAFDEARQQLAEKDARIKELEELLSNRDAAVRDQNLIIDSLREHCSYLQCKLSTALNTQKPPIENFMTWSAKRNSTMHYPAFLKMSPSRSEISDYLELLAGHFGREAKND